MNISILQQKKKELGISYDEIALRSGVPRATVTNVMCGYTKRPRIDTVQAIATVLGLDSVWTDNDITPEEYAQGVRHTKKISITADQEDIFDKTNEVLELLGEKGKILLLDFCDALIEKFGK